MMKIGVAIEVSQYISVMHKANCLKLTCPYCQPVYYEFKSGQYIVKHYIGMRCELERCQVRPERMN